MQGLKTRTSRIFLRDTLLKWKPPPEYEVEEMLHFPEIEQEKIRRDAGTLFEECEAGPIRPQPPSRLLEKYKFNRNDPTKIFNIKNSHLQLSRSYIHVFKRNEKGAIEGLKTSKSKLKSRRY